MPPKARITKDMVADAAMEVIREKGYENLNARAVAEKLSCSTQPVLYSFATMEELKRAAYARADGFHTAYLLNTPPECDPVLGIGLNYIRFAVEEPRLFRFLFQSGYVTENNLGEMIDSEELLPILSVIREGLGMSLEKTKEVFLITALCTHGYASLIANNGLEYDEEEAARHLETAFRGAAAVIGKKETV
ncbi:MAG: TetR/AcrR family transcriptional regulator [Clostridia bacterium]|nr:TetR/AcrR family transcriptional regulator [Clostridia bacterium]